jgi:DNA invertase Pin-like site-specific DNA recombinase
MSDLAGLAPFQCLLYRRISKDDDKDELAVQRQDNELRAHAQRQGWQVVGDFVDNDISASKRKRRPGYQALLEAVRAGHGDVILCTETARLTRHWGELVSLLDLVEEHKVRIVPLRGGAELDLNTSGGKMLARMLGAVASQEIETMVERMKSQQAQRRLAGKPHGGARCYGYRQTGPGQLRVDASEAVIINEIADRLLGGDTLKGITDDLNARRVPTTTEGDSIWHRATVRRLMSTPRIAGYVSTKGAIVTDAEGNPVRGNWEPILDLTTWRGVRDMLASAKRGPRITKFLLTGYARCGVCGTGLNGNTRTAGIQIYGCPNQDCPNRVTIVAKQLDAYIAGHVIASAYGANLANARARRNAGGGYDLEQDIADIEERQRELGRLFSQGRISGSALETADRGLSTALIEKQRARSRIRVDPLPADLVHLDEKVWEGLTFEQKRALIDLFVDHIVVHKALITAPRVFDAGRVSITPRMMI